VYLPVQLPLFVTHDAAVCACARVCFCRWEAEELVRKLLLSAVVVLIDSKSPLQVTLAVLVSGWSHVLHGMYKPWGKGSLLYTLQHGSLFVTTFVFLMGLLFKVDGVSDAASLQYRVLSVAMLALCGAFIALWLCAVVYGFTLNAVDARLEAEALQQRKSGGAVAATAVDPLDGSQGVRGGVDKRRQTAPSAHAGVRGSAPSSTSASSASSSSASRRRTEAALALHKASVAAARASAVPEQRLAETAAKKSFDALGASAAAAVVPGPVPGSVPGSVPVPLPGTPVFAVNPAYGLPQRSLHCKVHD
jgi:hypothetical protein